MNTTEKKPGRHRPTDWSPEITPIEGTPLVIVSTPWVDDSTFLVMDRHHAKHMHEPPYFFEWEHVPSTLKGEAIKIVHEGMAETIEWLRANGHVIKSWRDREWDDDRRAEANFRATERLSLMLHPNDSVLVTGAVT